MGPVRAGHAWPWHDILAAGAVVCFGSDRPVVSLSPWPALQVLRTRQTPEGTPAGGWIPDQRLTLEQVIRGCTMGGAVAAGRETTEGPIEAGKQAERIILSRDLPRADPDQIGNTKV